MKTKIFLTALFAAWMSNGTFAQDRTTVTATNSDISDNLDLKAVASIFGDSENLEDFERRLNDPKIQISNLDLNGDNQVDYLRVIESVEGDTHLVIVQAVLDRDVFQDVATVEVEQNGSQVQVQVVGNVYMYGNNYIYEPIYVNRPIIYNHFWAAGYHPYYSSWYWGYYPTYYYAWNPYPIYTYRNHIHIHINSHNHYNYVNTRRSSRAASLYNTRRANAYEVRHPENSFSRRNPNVTNRYELAQTRRSNNVGTRATSSTRNAASAASTGGIRPSAAAQTTKNSVTRTEATGTTRNVNTTRSQSATGNVRSNTPIRTESSANVRSTSPVRANTSQSTRTTTRANAASNSSSRSETAIRSNSNTASNISRTASPAAGVNTQPSTDGQRINAGMSRQTPTRTAAPQRNDQQRNGGR